MTIQYFEGKARIRGRVTVTGTRRPVSGASVKVTVSVVDRQAGWPPCAETEASTLSDADGNYALEVDGLGGLGKNSSDVYFWVAVTAARHVPLRVSPTWRRWKIPFTRRHARSPLAGSRWHVNVQLKPAYALAGRVVNEVGQPIPGVKVYIYESSSQGCSNPDLVGGFPVTDERGVFFADGMPLDLPPEKRQAAGFFHPNYERCFVQRFMNLPRNEADVADMEVTLRLGRVIQGTVETAQGSSVAGAKVLVIGIRSYEGDPACARPPAHWDLKTDTSGRFIARGLPPLFYHVIVTHPQQPPGSVMMVDLISQGESSVRVILDERACVLSGTVKNADGSPAVGMELKASQPLTHIEKITRTDAQGTYSFSGFAPSMQVCFAGPSRHQVLLAVLPPKMDADITMPEIVDIHGRLVGARTGWPLPWRHGLRLTADPIFGEYVDVISDPWSGCFRVKGVWKVKHWRYYLCLYRRRTMVVCRRLNFATGEYDIGDVPMHGSRSLRGYVRDPCGEGVSNAEVFLSGAQYYDGVTVRTNHKGRYCLKHLADGDYSLRVRADGWATFYQEDLSLSARGGVMLVNIVLEKGVKVIGRVLNAGKPVVQQIVVLSSPQNKDHGHESPWVADTNTDTDGSFCFAHVACGDYAIRCGLEVRPIHVSREENIRHDFQWPGTCDLIPPIA